MRFQTRPADKSAAALDEPYILRTGFREYDARWFLGRDLNYRGVQHIGHALGTYLHRRFGLDEVVVGHDYRSYSQHTAFALTAGLLRSGASVADVGLGVSPMTYFAQHHLGIGGAAMVTASHNPNGWTGVKMGYAPSRTFGPEHMSEFRELALGDGPLRDGAGTYRRVEGVREAYLKDLERGGALTRPLRVVVATGNGTAGWFTPDALRRIGCDVVPLHDELDWDFPHGNPNPESEAFMSQLAAAVVEHGAALGIGLDGDGDRIGVADAHGARVFSDKLGLVLARWLTGQVARARIVVDVKCTALFNDPDVLAADVVWEKTGHSYIKAAVQRERATAGFERSGHFFFAQPFGRGYDDATLSAIHVVRMLDQLGRPLHELLDELPTTHQSPTLQPGVADDVKYAVVAELVRSYEADQAAGRTLDGQPIARVVTINGARVELADLGWLLVRASSNTPQLVVIAESTTGEAQVRGLIADAHRRLAAFSVVDRSSIERYLG